MEVSLSSTAVATPTFVAPTVASATDLMFMLTVTDTRGLTDTAAVTLRVLADGARVVSLVPGIDTLVEGSDAIELVVRLDEAPETGVLVQLDSLQTVPSATPANVTYGLDYRVSIQDNTATDAACVTTDFSFDSAAEETLMSRRVVVPFPAGCASQTLLVSALEDLDGLDETLTFSLAEQGDSYAVTSTLEEAVRTLTVTDNELVVMLPPLLAEQGVDVIGVTTELSFPRVVILLPGHVAESTPVTVNIAVSGDIDDGDVSSGFDFDPDDSSLFLPAGERLTELSEIVIRGNITFDGVVGTQVAYTIIPDGIEEDEETAIVTLLAGDGYRLPATGSSRSLTILDSLRATIPDTTVRTAVEGGAAATVTVQLSRGIRPDLDEFAFAVVEITPLPMEEAEYSVDSVETSPVRFVESAMRYEVNFPDQVGTDRVTVSITALEDSDSDDEVLTLRLIRLQRPSNFFPVAYFTFADPAPEVTIILEDNDAGAVLAGTLTEDTLNDSTVTVTLLNTEYAGTPSAADFTLTTDLPGLTVSDVTDASTTRATLTLAYSGGDITADTTLSVTVLASGHTGDDPLTTNALAIIANTAPIFAPATIADQTYTVGVGIDDLILPVAAGGNGTLTYTLTPDLSAGLTFDDQALEISGRPETAQPAIELPLHGDRQRLRSRCFGHGHDHLHDHDQRESDRRGHGGLRDGRRGGHDRDRHVDSGYRHLHEPGRDH